MYRRAAKDDIPGVVRIYEKIFELEARGKANTGWIKGVYPTEGTAREALSEEELFVFEEGGRVLASARINRKQEPEYANCSWTYDAPDSEVMVIHTLVVDPEASGRGVGGGFVRFYEDYALRNSCPYLRMDTNVINSAARALYKKLGYSEQGVISCTFNGIGGVQLVCLEKKLG